MTRREIAALCCRVTALVVLSWSVVYFAMMVPILGAAVMGPKSARYGTATSVAASQLATYGTVGCMHLLVAMALAWKARTISRWMASDDPAPVTGPELSAAALMPVACAGVGLYAVTHALPTFFRMIGGMTSGEFTWSDYWNDEAWRSSLISDGLLLAWGIWLTFGSRGLVRLILWAQSAAKNESSPEETMPSSSPSPPALGS